MKKIVTSNAPAAIGPYSQGIQTGNLVYFSGQLGINPSTGKIVDGGIEAETRQVFANIEALLSSQNLSFTNVVKTLVLLSDIKNFSSVNEIYSEFFSEPYPTRSAFAVADLPLGGLIEVEVIAEIKQN